jgi:hypothetical protein
MEQLQELLPAKDLAVNQKLRDLFKRAFEIRQIQLMVMRDIDEKYKSFEPITNTQIESK